MAEKWRRMAADASFGDASASRPCHANQSWKAALVHTAHHIPASRQAVGSVHAVNAAIIRSSRPRESAYSTASRRVSRAAATAPARICARSSLPSNWTRSSGPIELATAHTWGDTGQEEGRISPARLIRPRGGATSAPRPTAGTSAAGTPSAVVSRAFPVCGGRVDVRDHGDHGDHGRSLYARITVSLTVLPSASVADARSDTVEAFFGCDSLAVWAATIGACRQVFPSS